MLNPWIETLDDMAREFVDAATNGPINMREEPMSLDEFLAKYGEALPPDMAQLGRAILAAYDGESARL